MLFLNNKLHSIKPHQHNNRIGKPSNKIRRLNKLGRPLDRLLMDILRNLSLKRPSMLLFMLPGRSQLLLKRV